MAASLAAAARTAGTPSTSYSSASTAAPTWLPRRHARGAPRYAAAAQPRTRPRAAAAASEVVPWPGPPVDSGTSSSSSSSSSSQQGSQAEAKRQLLSWIAGTKRGSDTSSLLRGQIEEAQVAVESFAPEALDYALLEGLWRLEYTTALDVTPIVGFDPPSLALPLPGGAVLPPPLRVGGVFQRFSSVARGRVDNVIQFSLPGLTEPARGVTFTVEASYEVRSPHRIALTFNSAEVGQLRISAGLEALLAPALLPRGSLNHMLLLALKEFKLSFPFRTAQQVARGAGVAASYLLTYLDGDMLIGRGPQGTFIFTRAEEES